MADEARIGQKNKITRRWARRGTRPSAPHDQRTRSTYIFGAICPKEGKAAGLVLPWCNTATMNLHLAEIAQAVAPGAHAVLMVDQAGWHMTPKLTVPPNISIIPLPAKSPELNPQENVWQFMRDNWLSNRIFTSYGAPGGLPEPFRRAVATTPRHLFVHRFRLAGGPLGNRTDDSSLWDSDADPMVALADIYSDAVMTHVDAAGSQLPSTNSQPSYVLWLLSMLDLQPGHRVLEIGSGSGWLAAMMGRLVGDDGQVTGIEIIPELAAQSRADLVRLGIGNVRVLATDGAHGHAGGAPFDRVMITAASWEVPDALFDQVAEGGRLLVPVELRGGGCQVTVLHREGSGFMAERAVPGWFVPLLGSQQQRPRLRFALAELPFCDDIKGAAPSRRVKLPLAMGPDGMAGSAVTAFRAFLGRTAPGFAVFGEGEPPEQRPGIPAEPFGIVDPADGSVALWRGGELVGYGGPGAMRSAARAYAFWASCGLPGLAEMGLQILRAGDAPAAGRRAWVEKRGGTVLVWSPPPGAEDWKELLDGAA